MSRHGIYLILSLCLIIRLLLYSQLTDVYLCFVVIFGMAFVSSIFERKIYIYEKYYFTYDFITFKSATC